MTRRASIEIATSRPIVDRIRRANDGPSARGRAKLANTMDWWLRGRIIYTYSLWVVFKAAAVGGIFGEYTRSTLFDLSLRLWRLFCPRVQRKGFATC